MSELLHWYEKNGPQGDIVCSTRVRLARNLKGFPFPATASVEEKGQIEKKVREALLSGNSILSKEFKFLPLQSLSREQAVSLVERHLVSPDFIADKVGKAVLVSADESVSIMINEEDHLRIQVLREGLSLEEAAQTCDRIDTLLNETLEFAFDPEFGYLTQCPTNIGTGMRASVMLHLPVLHESGAMPRITANLAKLGLTVRGTYGEGSQVSGSLYQLSNQITLGLSEKEAVDNLLALTQQLIQEERKLREQVQSSISFQDRIDRAAGVLKSARLISAGEFSQLISWTRLGLSLGTLQGVTPGELNSLAMRVQPATLMADAGKPLEPEERDIRRAQLSRATFHKLEPVIEE